MEKLPFSGSVLKESKNFMVVKMTNLLQNSVWFVVNMYYPNSRNSRKKVWNTLSNIKNKEQNGRWIFMGDFNVPIYDQEQKGNNASQLEGRLDLLEFINNEGLMDMDLHGVEFTWTNKRVGNECIQV